MQTLINDWVELTESLNWTDEKLHVAAHIAFSLVKSHALMTKHSGFSEENEWRVIYYPERDAEEG